MYCEKCGKHLSDDDNYCYNCGNPVFVGEDNANMRLSFSKRSDEEPQTEKKQHKRASSKDIESKVASIKRSNQMNSFVLFNIKAVGNYVFL